MNLIVIIPFLVAMLKKYLIEKAVGAVVKTAISAATLDKRNLSDDVQLRKAYAKKHGGYYWGNSSWRKLKTTCPEIQRLMNQAIKHMNLTVLCGERDKKAQDKAVVDGASGVEYPFSKHNPGNSINSDGKGVRAIDIAYWPTDWKDLEQFCYIGGKIMLLAKQLKIPMRWGADWNRGGDMRDDKERGALRDYVHYEYVEGEVVI